MEEVYSQSRLLDSNTLVAGARAAIVLKTGLLAASFWWAVPGPQSSFVRCHPRGLGSTPYRHVPTIRLTHARFPPPPLPLPTPWARAPSRSRSELNASSNSTFGSRICSTLSDSPSTPHPPRQPHHPLPDLPRPPPLRPVPALLHHHLHQPRLPRQRHHPRQETNTQIENRKPNMHMPACIQDNILPQL